MSTKENMLVRKLTKEEIEMLREDLTKIPLTPFKNTNRSVANIGYDYPFSGVTVPKQEWSLYPNIRAIMEQLNEELGTNFNSCLVTKYNKGVAVGLGAHTDREPVLVPYSPVVSISLGINSDCKFIFRDIKTKAVVETVILSHGDVYYMNNECQYKYTHEIPKTVFPYGRISLTFRVFKEQ